MLTTGEVGLELDYSEMDLSIELWEHLVNNVEWNINQEDVSIFVEGMNRLNKDLFSIESVDYSDIEEDEKLSELGYDGAYIVNKSDYFAWNYGGSVLHPVEKIMSFIELR